MTTNTQDVVAERVEEVLEQLFEIKDGFYSSGDYTTKRFAVWELRKTLTQLVKEVEAGERERVKEIALHHIRVIYHQDFLNALTPPTSDVIEK